MSPDKIKEEKSHIFIRVATDKVKVKLSCHKNKNRFCSPSFYLNFCTSFEIIGYISYEISCKKTRNFEKISQENERIWKEFFKSRRRRQCHAHIQRTHLATRNQHISKFEINFADIKQFMLVKFLVFLFTIYDKPFIQRKSIILKKKIKKQKKKKNFFFPFCLVKGFGRFRW